MYSVDAYGRMIADAVRSEAYAEAMRRAIRPGSVVVDLGAGTGAFSLLACQLGAARVYAIETNPAVAIARESAVANGFGDRVVTLDRLSTAVELPEQADVLISDLRGTLPLHEQHIPSIVDARRRFLRQDGVQIPASDDLWVAPVYDEGAHRELTDPWSAFDLDMRAGQRYAVNAAQERKVAPDDVVAEPRCWATLDYRTIEVPNIAGSAEWHVEEPVAINGMCLWFTAHLLDGISYTTSPFDPVTVYGMMLLPLAEVVEAKAQEQLRVQLRADMVAGSYVWTWITEHRTQDGTHKMRQSTFLSTPAPFTMVSDDAIESARPQSTARARAASLALGLIDGERTLGSVAHELMHAFPALFSSRLVAVRFVSDLAESYSAWEAPRPPS